MIEALELLIAERDRLNEAIAILQRGTPRRGRKPRSESTEDAAATAPTKKKRGRGKMSAAQKKAVSARMKQYWADRKKGKK
jgi:hypothetical protein